MTVTKTKKMVLPGTGYGYGAAFSAVLVRNLSYPEVQGLFPEVCSVHWHME